ncbi:MAG: diacylglycerol kinase family protein [Chlamydiota bacterium]|nr:diacylglycerol kinase family protein [Chlamydiota bacterium]
MTIADHSMGIEPCDTLFLVNPNANEGKARKIWEKLSQKIYTGAPGLNEMHTIRCVVTQSSEEAISTCRDAVNTGVKKVIAVGGDGTIHTVIHGLISNGDLTNPEIEFGIMPLGNCNDFSLNLNLKTKSLSEALEQLASGPTKPVDIGRVTYTRSNGDLGDEFFLNMVSIGLSAEVANELNTKKKKFTTFNYLKSLKKVWKDYHPPEILFNFDQGATEQFQCSVKTAVIANGCFSCDGWKLAPDALLDDRLFDITVIEKMKLNDILTLKGKTKKGSFVHNEGVTTLTANKIRVSSPDQRNLTVEINGYTPGSLPATFEFLPNQLKVITG